MALWEMQLYNMGSCCLFQVDFEESAVQNRFVVKPYVDPELDESKCNTYIEIKYFP